MIYPFTEADMQKANDTWKANCGPAALAFALQIPIADVRGKIPGFEERGYTNPSMMKAALGNLGKSFSASAVSEREMFWPGYTCLVRVQWCGPWTAPGVNPKWAYRFTHWVATCMIAGHAAAVFDCNGGIRSFDSWQKEIVPLITSQIPRADGKWHPTHIWRIEK